MTASVRRKFTILDGMILVAAIACGFALRRAFLNSFHGVWVIQGESWLMRNARGLNWAATPFLTMLTPTVLLLRLRRPRPRQIELFRQPGLAAGCAAILPIAMSLACFIRESAGRSGELQDPLSAAGAGLHFQYVGSYRVGCWVLGSWLALFLSGRRRPERSWIDRIGRILGIGWLVVLVLDMVDPMY